MESRYAIMEQSGEYPPLLLIYSGRLSEHAVRNLRESYKMAVENKSGFLVLEENFQVYQLISGRWISLDGSTELEDAPVPDKINFREFI